MRRRWFFGKTTISAVIAAGMLLQGTTVLADSPLEELKDIMEDQQEAASESLLKQTLGLHDLQEAIEDHGLDFGLKAALSSGTAETIGIADQIPEDGSVSLGLQVNPEQKAWAVTAGVGTEEESLIDLALYGERDLLALSIPQFYSGALAIRSGNFKEQYEDSALAAMLGEMEDIPSIDLKFYPDEEELDIWEDLFDDLEDGMEDRIESLEKTMQVEKEQDGDTTIYKATVSSEDIMGIYSELLKEYFSWFETSGLLTVTDGTGDFETQIDAMIDQMGAVLGDDVTVEFLVQDDLVQEIRYDLYCDTTQLADQVEAAVDEAEEVMTEIVEEELAPSGNAENASAAAGNEEDVIGGAEETTQIELESADFKGVMSYDIVYWDPADLSRGFYMNMTATDEDGQEVMGCYIDWTSVIEESTQDSMLYLQLTENGETIYDGMPFYTSFDQESGDYYVTLSMNDENDGAVSLNLYSNFSEIQKGRSFVWNIDELSVLSEAGSAGVTAQIQVSADPGEIEKPQDVKQILELTQEELTSVVQEIGLKAALWSAKFDNAVEAQTEDAADINSGV